MDPTTRLDSLAREAEAEFARRFGRPARVVAAAPGRVNLIGEHTDYNDGFVLPMAIDRHVVLAADRAAAGAPGPARLYSTAVGEAAAVPAGGPPEQSLPGWARYVQGVLAGCAAAGLAPGPFDAVIHSDVPLGGGLSSSAALEVAVATLAEALAGRALGPADKGLLCQKAEHDFAGVPCGIMDQFSSVLGRRGALLLLDCRSRAVEWADLADPDVLALVVNSNVRHALVRGEYAARRRQCQEAAAALGVASLRDVGPADLDRRRGRLGEVLYRRARHVVTENARTLAAAGALRAGDWACLGGHMYASHASLRDDYEVSCPELDLLVELAAGLGEAGGVIGSRMTGGGFGGCTVTLVRRGAADAVMRHLSEGYAARTGRQATAFATSAADGARVLRRDGAC
jgi:galactokinase